MTMQKFKWRVRVAELNRYSLDVAVLTAAERDAVATSVEANARQLWHDNSQAFRVESTGDILHITVEPDDALTSKAARAERAAAALAAYRGVIGDMACAPEEDLIDLLSDLRHYADRHDVSFGNCDRSAFRNYVAELGNETDGGDFEIDGAGTAGDA